jgi:hypothetical protein
LTNKAIEANEANADEAEDVDKAIVVVKAKAKEAFVANEADVANKANEANKADKAVDCNEAKVNEANFQQLQVISVVFVDDGYAISLDYLFPFSLTKYSAIFAEVKGYF